MNILIIGSGGREHTFAWKIKQSHQIQNLYVAPGNAGTALLAENVAIDVLDFEQIANFVKEKNIAIVLVGPEVPLVAGIVDYFQSNTSLSHVLVVGPNKLAAQLEGSKDFSKKFMQKYQIPTASYQTFDSSTIAEGIKYLEQHSLPIVLKADGLAAGKGVIIAQSHQEAKETLLNMLQDNLFGAAGAKVVVEQFLSGIELSVFTLSDGQNYVLLPEAKDYKRIGEKDTGLNTGGMGAVSPVPFADEIFMNKVKNKIIKPTFEGLKTEGINYVGFIFFGLINVAGEPYVIEYNARMGDPETEVVVPRIENDFVEILESIRHKKLDAVQMRTNPQTATTVMLVAEGYPGNYRKGDFISGADSTSEAMVFHAGTVNKDGQLLTNGGRVMSITALGDDIEQALLKSNTLAESISWQGKYYRKDIGLDLLNLA
jgi:phosphoribosylamine--glycine ligase